MADDVILHCLDCWLCRVGVVVVGLHILSCGVLYLQEVLDGAGAFIVKDVELGLVVNLLQVYVDSGEASTMLTSSLDFIGRNKTVLNL